MNNGLAFNGTFREHIIIQLFARTFRYTDKPWTDKLWTDKPWTDKPWTRQTLDTTNPGQDKPWTRQTLDRIEPWACTLGNVN
jgi:hypothetical protein